MEEKNRKIMMVDNSSLLKIKECFVDEEELLKFSTHVLNLQKSLDASDKLIISHNLDLSVVFTLTKFLSIALFAREHIELIHDMIKKISLRAATEAEIELLNMQEHDDEIVEEDEYHETE